MKINRSKVRRGGFTLLELLVAMGITAVIVTVLVVITGTATDTWTRSRSEVRSARQAKLFLDTMASDLESLVARNGYNFEWLIAETDNDADLPRVAREGQAPEVAALTFLTAATDRYLGEIGDPSLDEGGDVSCVSYRLRHQNLLDGGDEDSEVFVLYRLLVDPDEAFDDLLGQEDLESAFSSYETRVDEAKNFVCENVCQFTLTFLVDAKNGDGEIRTARLTLDAAGGSGSLRLGGSGLKIDGLEPPDAGGSAFQFSQDALQAGRLRGVELNISVVSDAGLTRINATGDGLNEKDYDRNVYHYSRVVELPGM